MATIRTAILLQDGMTPVLQSMNNALNICINSFETMQRASGQAVNTGSIAAATAGSLRVKGAIIEVAQNISEANNAQKQFNSNMGNSPSIVEKLADKIKDVTTIMAGAGKVLNLSDTVTQTTARLDLMNDKQQTTAELQEKIFQSAQRARGAYQTTADAVTNLGIQAADAFTGNDEVIAFTEQLNKSFVIAGTSTAGIESAMSQVTQAMAGGKLEGAGLETVLANAEPVVANIQNYLQNVKGMPKSATDNIKQLAADGVITADVLKNAMFYAADETNSKFATMPKTFTQILNSIENHAGRAFQPVLQKINEIANSDGFGSFVNGAISAMYALSNEIQYIMNQSEKLFEIIGKNWSFIEPVIWGVVAAYAVYNAAMGIGWLTTLQNIAVKVAHTAVSWAETAAIIAMEAAQYGLNAAFALCPITWVIMGVVALITMIYLAVAAYNSFAGTSVSATGLIIGAFFVVGAVIGNIIITMINLLIDSFAMLWNYIATFAEFFANVFNDPIGSIVRLFVDMADNVLGILSSIASAIDTLFGSKLASSVEGWRSTLKNTVKTEFGEAAIKVQRVDQNAMHLDQINYGVAWDAGKAMGTDIGNKFKLGNFGNLSEPNSKQGLGPDLSKFGNDMAKTANNTDKMKDSLNITEEDLKYLRDIAEQEVINRFTTAEINVDMTNHNTVNSDMDLDGIVTYMKDSIVESMQSAAEGVHK